MAVGAVTEPTEEELQPWHDLYRAVKETDRKVTVPFAEEIAKRLPTSHFVDSSGSTETEESGASRAFR